MLAFELCHDPIPVPEGLRLAADLARGVAVLHQHGVLHRDLKPANVLLVTDDDGPRPVIADLGMAKRLAEASGLTVAAGTPAYMAPEQARGLGLDEQTDVYGIAAVCYRILSGQVRSPASSATTVANRPIDWRPPPMPPTVEIPAAATELLQEALSTDPDRRPASATALADRLDALVGRPVTAAIGPRSVAAVARVRRPRVPMVVGLALLVFAAVITWIVLSLVIPR